MADEEREDLAKELQQIASNIDNLASDLTDDKYSEATDKIRSALEGCKKNIGFVIENLK